MLHSVIGLVVPNDSKNCSAVIFRVKQSRPNILKDHNAFIIVMRQFKIGLLDPEDEGTASPMTQCHVL
jgi:hypothetical protein